MKKYFVFLLTIITLFAALGTGCGKVESGPLYKAKTRVNGILKAITKNEKGEPTDEQLAACRWWCDYVLLTDPDELSLASEDFDKWRLEKDIYPTIDEYEITGAELVEGAEYTTVIVYATIDGVELAIRVPDKRTISWSDE